MPALEALSSDFRASVQVITDLDALLDEVQAAQFLNVSTRCLQAWRQRGGGPRFVRISSRCLRYRRRDLLTWSEERLARSTSDTSCEK
jgi:predicted DNA-binding transcriptional regulator AlpA